MDQARSRGNAFVQALLPWLLVTLVVALFASVGTQQQPPTTELFNSHTEEPRTTNLQLHIASDYPQPPGLRFYPWEYLVEPFRTASLSIVDSNVNEESTPVVYDLLWKNSLGAQAVKAIGTTSIRVQCTHAGSMYSLQVFSADTFSAHSSTASPIATFDVVCKYVRRELRRLSSTDKSRFLRALSTFYRKETYNRYDQNDLSIGDYTACHLRQLTNSDGSLCSPYHAGSVFLTAHDAFVHSVEKSLQQIDPTVSVSPWNFVIDSTIYTSDVNWALQTPILGDEWFGKTCKESNYVISDGSFALLSLGNVEWGPHNPSDVLTNTDNMNPSKHLQRAPGVFCDMPVSTKFDSHKMDCEHLLLATTSGSLSELTKYVVEFHMDLHGFLGGRMSCSVSLADISTEFPEFWEGFQDQSCQSTLFKSYDSYDAFSCPESCDSLLSSSCQCTCSELIRQYGSDFSSASMTELYEILTNTGGIPILKSVWPSFELSEVDGFPVIWYPAIGKKRSESFLRLFVMLRCTIPFATSFSSPLAAPQDPVFWSTYALIVQILAYLRLTSNDISTSDWLVSTSCEGAELYDEVVPFANFGRPPTGQYYTNAELWDIFDPSALDLPFIYEDFDWSICSG